MRNQASAKLAGGVQTNVWPTHSLSDETCRMYARAPTKRVRYTLVTSLLAPLADVIDDVVETWKLLRGTSVGDVALEITGCHMADKFLLTRL
ncbi:hypothetical protein LIER_40827 [Lithospermum erythrorhizon]|uniref:Uncharacterized protein n=1 Tax=Lithospermum erythrorhizon TaxID=34254 RepID=A0AAV3R1N1_LITER